MKTKILVLFVTACVLASCAKKDSESSTSAESSKEPVAECFAYTAAKDSAWLHINIGSDGLVDGELDYKLFEKDQNHGKIDGKINGDTLVAQYKFMSEGVESTREVAFLKKDGNWVEGFGPVEEKDGGMTFSNRSKLDFSKGLAFKKTECR